jgi:hypothetical protein
LVLVFLRWLEDYLSAVENGAIFAAHFIDSLVRSVQSALDGTTLAQADAACHSSFHTDLAVDIFVFGNFSHFR